MCPISPDEAWAATDPSLPKEQREAAASAILAGVAANDAYINSRGELEQVILRAQGGQAPPTHTDLNSEDAQKEAGSGTPPAQVGAGEPAVESSAEEAAEVDLLDATPDELRARLAQLEGTGAAASPPANPTPGPTPEPGAGSPATTSGGSGNG